MASIMFTGCGIPCGSLRTTQRLSSGDSRAQVACRSSGRRMLGAKGERYSRPPAQIRTLAAPDGQDGPVDGETDADWDAEMSIFKKRTMKPSQLATLRQIEGEASLGKVVYIEQDLVIVEGLNDDSHAGTVVSFASGARGVLLWRRSDNVCFILCFGGASSISIGTPVQCNIQGVLQVVDENEGAVTKRKYEIARVAVDGLNGEIVDYFGRLKGTETRSIVGKTVPMLNKSPNMEDRGQICESLFTGVAAVDTLAPLGRGQSILLAGLLGSGTKDLMIEAIIGQKKTGVRCVLALIGEEEGVAEEIKSKLSEKGAMANTTIVEAPKGSSLSHSYMAICTSMAIAEGIRDEGGHSVVMVSNLAPMVELWDQFTESLIDMGPKALELGVAGVEPRDTESMEKEEMVEYEGTLVSASAAQRRQFFAALIQRAAKMHPRLGRGSLTFIGTLAGTPATGIAKKKKAIIEKYKTLTDEQRAKMLAVLEKQEGLQGVDPDADRKLVSTDVVEEFMSLTDGQIVLDAERDSASGCMVVNPAASISRIGNRAYEAAMVDVATPIRTSIAQADDAQRASMDDDSSIADINRALRARALLVQDLGSPVPLEELVVKLFALESGSFDSVEPRRIKAAATMAVQECWLLHPEVLKEIRDNRKLSADNKETLLEWLNTREVVA